MFVLQTNLAEHQKIARNCGACSKLKFVTPLQLRQKSEYVEGEKGCIVVFQPSQQPQESFRLQTHAQDAWRVRQGKGHVVKLTKVYYPQVCV